MECVGQGVAAEGFLLIVAGIAQSSANLCTRSFLSGSPCAARTLDGMR